MKFSERIGFAKPREILQLNSADNVLRVRLFNVAYSPFENSWSSTRSSAMRVWNDFLAMPVDDFELSTFRRAMRSKAIDGPWFAVYELIEFMHNKCRHIPLSTVDINEILQEEGAGYRYKDKRFIAITDEIEISAVSEAMSLPAQFSGARKHIETAVEQLSLKPTPDLRNTIKESISAVESAARVISGNRKATLGDAIKAIEKSGLMHSALKDAWLKLYGYTSDESGIRHAMIEEPSIDFGTAKYMLVSCSAFVNLLSMLPVASNP